ncbi:unnamed protein product, partial [Mesorhabditis spiculigera]
KDSLFSNVLSEQLAPTRRKRPARHTGEREPGDERFYKDYQPTYNELVLEVKLKLHREAGHGLGGVTRPSGCRASHFLKSKIKCPTGRRRSETDEESTSEEDEDDDEEDEDEDEDEEQTDEDEEESEEDAGAAVPDPSPKR